MTLRANNKVHVAAVARQIENLEGPQVVMPLAMIFGKGLMVPPLPLRLAVRFRAWRGRMSIAEAWCQTMIAFWAHERTRPTVYEMARQTVGHIKFGHDTEDSDSVGGFSQRELDLVVEILGQCEQSWRRVQDVAA